MDGLTSHPGKVPHVLFRNLQLLTDADVQRADSPETFDGRNLTFMHATMPVIWVVEVAELAGFVLLARRRIATPLVLSAVYLFVVSFLTVAPPRLRAPDDALGAIAIGVLVDALLVMALRRRAASGPAVEAG